MSKNWIRIVLTIIIITEISFLNAQPAINYAEYYINTDPGKGNGTSISLINLPDLSFNYDHSTLSQGIHRIGVRSRDINNTWSKDALWLMIKYQTPMHSANPDIVEAEYYVNNDPGIGNGTSISVSNLPDLTFIFNYTGLGTGVHRIGVRTKDNNGVWSKDAYWVFVNYQAPVHSSIANVVAAEYYINSDPGKGNGTSISLAGLPDLSFAFSHSELGYGVHRVGVRTKDGNGIWSKDAFWVFANLPLPIHNNVSNIVAAEYYINTDPGKGNGSPISILNLPDLNIAINLENVSNGVHRLGVRTKNAAGQWGKDIMWLFSKIGIDDNDILSQVVSGEYYIDSDPGKGNGNPIVFEESTNIDGKIFVVNLAGLTNTMHKLGVRTKDDNGKWSLDNEYEFTLNGSVPTPNIIISSVKRDEICKEGNLVFSFDANGIFNSGNIFTAQISDENSSFNNPTDLGNITNNNANLFSVYLPESLSLGDGYKLRVNADNPNVLGETSAQTISIYHSPFFPDSLFGTITDCPDGTLNLFSLYDTTTLLSYNWNTPTPMAAPAGNYTLIANNLDGCKDTTQASINTELEIARWIGSTNFDWHTATNWDTGEVPNANTHVIIEPSSSDCTIRFFDADAMSVRTLDLLVVFNNRLLHIHGNCGLLPD